MMNYRILKILIVLTFSCTYSGAQEVIIDLSTNKGPMTHVASGFLHTVRSKTVASTQTLDPLAPKHFRHRPSAALDRAIYDRIQDFGGTLTMVLSDGWGYSGTEWPGDNGNWTKWEKLVSNYVDTILTNKLNIYYDIWNESNYERYWPRSEERFLETWRRAVQIIRDKQPDAVIVGPSYTKEFPYSKITDFLLYAKKNNVLPTALCWHEMHSDGNLVVEHTAQLRKFMAEHDITIPQFHINEYSRYESHIDGAKIIKYFVGLHKAKIDVAVRACWSNGDCSGCSPETLNNLATCDGKPKSIWWAYKGYADITGNLVDISNTSKLIGIGGKDAYAGNANFVIGALEDAGSVTLRFKNIDSTPYLNINGAVKVVAQRVLYSGNEPTKEPIEVLNKNIKVTNNEISIVLPDFEKSQVFLLNLNGIQQDDLVAPANPKSSLKE
ncbi:hypothetical protein [Siansivirga zeaxanthinifaciens]|nr:hypothetical protein [Siansivirga zeaxanthinifaciens]